MPKLALAAALSCALALVAAARPARAWTDPCAASATCYALRAPGAATRARLRDTLDARIRAIVETWYAGGKCDFNGSGPAPAGACSARIAGARVGAVCNLAAGEVATNHLGASCGTACAPTLTCTRSRAYPNRPTASWTVNADPVAGCRLCQWSFNPVTPAQFAAVAATTDGVAAMQLSQAQGTAAFAGTSCGCCTLDAKPKTCNREAAWMRGALVEGVRRGLARMQAELARPDPVIAIPAGAGSACATLRQKLQAARADFDAKNVDAGNDACTEPPESDTALLQRLRGGGLQQGACIREGVRAYLDHAAVYLAACRILEDAESLYVRLHSPLRALYAAADCTGQATLAGCVQAIDQRLRDRIGAEVAAAFP